METKIETIRQKCIEANPSILDLKFGCEVVSKGIQGHLILFGAGISGYLFQQPAMNDELSSRSSTYELPLEKVTILGRPIRLADVLLVINKINTYCIRSDSDFLKFDEDYKRFISFGISWNLLEDDLTKQSPETIDFIYELIK